MKLQATLACLNTQRSQHETQIELIKQAEKVLQNGGPECFEVHFQRHWPDHKPVTESDSTISGAYEKALKTWGKLNSHSASPGHGSADVFARFGDLLVPVLPQDASRIACAEVCAFLGIPKTEQFKPEQFTLDKRLIQPVGKTVWSVNEYMPGWHKS